jgi:hypothetical protein
MIYCLPATKEVVELVVDVVVVVVIAVVVVAVVNEATAIPVAGGDFASVLSSSLVCG